MKKLVKATAWINLANAFLAIYAAEENPYFALFAMLWSLIWLMAFVKANFYEKTPDAGTPDALKGLNKTLTYQSYQKEATHGNTL